MPSHPSVRVFSHILKCRCLYYNQEWMNIQDLTEESSKEEIEKTLRKASAISKIAAQIISNGNLVLRAKELEVAISGRSDTKFPKMLEG